MLTGGLFPLGFSYEKDTRLYFDDTCVVPERLEGKQPAKGQRGQAPHPGVPTEEPPGSEAAQRHCCALAMPLGLSTSPCPGAEPAVSLWTGKVKQEPTLYREGPPYQRRGSLQLWQFLVTLLDDPANAHFIAWTGRGMEFKLIEPEEVWGV